MPEANITLRELLEQATALRWLTHEAKHAAMQEALHQAAASIAHASDLRWRSHADQHDALDQARDAAANAILSKLETMNEFRAQLTAQAATFVTREMVSDKEEAHLLMHDHTRARISALEQWRAVVDTKFWALGIGISVFTFVINILSRYLFK